MVIALWEFAVMPPQNTLNSVGCWCGTRPMNTALLASCSRLVVPKSTPIGKIAVLGAGLAEQKLFLMTSGMRKVIKIHKQIEQ